MSHFVTGLDVGTSSIKGVVIELFRKRKPALRACISVSSQGIQKGIVVDQEDALIAVERALNEICAYSKAAARSLYVNIGGRQTSAQTSRAMIPLSRGDVKITKEDVQRIVKVAETSVKTGANRTIVHAVTRDFIVDGIGDIIDPIGLSGTRLEANCIIIDAFAPNVQKVTQCIEDAGGSLAGYIYGPLAAARAVLTKGQKDLGVLAIDCGSGTTGVVAYEEQKLLHAGVFLVGAANVTNDIALGLKISIEEAEALKLSYGYALAREIPQKENVIAKTEERQQISRRFLSEIIEVRLAEVFEFINSELKTIGKSAQLPAGAVLVGGGSKLPGIVELARRELRLPVQIGVTQPSFFSEVPSHLEAHFEDPEYATALGLALHGADEQRQSVSLLDLRGFFKNFLP